MNDLGVTKARLLKKDYPKQSRSALSILDGVRYDYLHSLAIGLKLARRSNRRTGVDSFILRSPRADLPLWGEDNRRYNAVKKAAGMGLYILR